MKRVTRSRRVRSNIWRFGSDSDSSEENEDAYSSSNEKQPKKSLEKEPHKEDHGTSDWAGASGDPLDERSLRIDSSDEGEIVETESSPDRIPGALTRTNVSRDIATQSTNIFTNDVAVQTNVAKRNAALIDKGVQTEKPVAANIVEYMKDRLRNEDFMEGFKAAIELSEAFITKGQFLTLAGSYQGALTNIAPQAPLAIAAPFVQPQQLLQQQILRNFNPDANCFGQWSGQPAGNWAQPSRVVEPSSNFIPSPSFPNNHSFVVNPAHQGFAAAEPSPNFAPPQPFSNNHPFIANSALQGFADIQNLMASALQPINVPTTSAPQPAFPHDVIANLLPQRVQSASPDAQRGGEGASTSATDRRSAQQPSTSGFRGANENGAENRRRRVVDSVESGSEEPNAEAEPINSRLRKRGHPETEAPNPASGRGRRGRRGTRRNF